MKEWQTLFNISEETYHEWESMANETSVIHWALINNKIDPSKYFEWASIRYSLPILKSSFIDNFHINQKLQKRIKDHTIWNETYMPIYEWDNILFVGCIEPPDILQDLSLVPILVSPRDLRMIWGKLNSSETIGNSTLDIADTHSSKPNEHLDTSSITFDDNNDEKTAITAVTKFKNSLLKTITKRISQSKQVQTHPSKNKPLHPIFAQSKKHFEHSILFYFRQDQFIPLKWSPSINKTPPKSKTSEDSIFKIISISKQEYHGFIASNNIHLNFFKSCGLPKLPEHITLIPILGNSGTLLGAFMGIAHSTVDAEHLDEINTWVENVKHTIFKKQLSKTA